MSDEQQKPAFVADLIAEVLKKMGNPVIGGAWEGEIVFEQISPGEVEIRARFKLPPEADTPTILERREP